MLRTASIGKKSRCWSGRYREIFCTWTMRRSIMKHRKVSSSVRILFSVIDHGKMNDAPGATQRWRVIVVHFLLSTASRRYWTKCRLWPHQNISETCMNQIFDGDRNQCTSNFKKFLPQVAKLEVKISSGFTQNNRIAFLEESVHASQGTQPSNSKKLALTRRPFFSQVAFCVWKRSHSKTFTSKLWYVGIPQKKIKWEWNEKYERTHTFSWNGRERRCSHPWERRFFQEDQQSASTKQRQ